MMLGQHLRHAVRRLLTERGFSVAAIVALGLGIGGANAIFTLMNGIFYRGLPSPDPEQLVSLGITDRRGPDQLVSPTEFDQWSRDGRAFSSLTASASRSLVLIDEGRPAERFLGTYISASTFGMLVERPVMGRDFSSADDRPGAPLVAVLGYTAWQRRYGSDRGVIGRAVTINGTPATIVGVMREGFRYPAGAEVWVPLGALTEQRERPDERMLNVAGRLLPEFTRAQAAAEITTITNRAARRTGGDVTTTVAVQPFTEAYIGRPVAMIMTALLIAVGLLVLIGCANVANLMLARAAARHHEFAVRMAIEASRHHVLTQLLMESLVIAIGAGALGLLVSRVAVGLFDVVTGRIASRPYWFDFSLDGRVVAFLALVSLATVLLSGLLPAFRAAGTDSRDCLTDRGRVGTAPRHLTDALIVVELALTLALLASAALMTRSVFAMLDVGFDTAPLGTMRVVVPDRYTTDDQRIALVRMIEERLATEPAIASVAVVSSLPAYGALRHELEIAGRPTESDRRPPADVLAVGPSYFEAMGLSLQRGRGFTADDGGAGSPAVIVNDAFVARYFPTGDPLGEQVRLTDPRTGAVLEWATIVGVAPTVRQRSYEGRTPMVYVPWRARPATTMGLVIRARNDVGVALTAARTVLMTIDRELPMFDVLSMDEALSQVTFLGPLFGSIFAAFALVALILCTTGLYAVTAYVVSRRQREIGVRIALGAQTHQVRWLVMRRAIVQLGIGLPIGLAGAIAMGGLLRQALASPDAGSPVTIALAALALITIMLAACLVPAHRAARLDPVTALRAD